MKWGQFKKDLANYTPEVKAEVAVADSIDTLPTLKVDIQGEVATNMPAFRGKALAYIEGINKHLVEDVDFANAEADIKFCKDAEGQLKDVKEAAFNQTSDIKEVMETINTIGSKLRDTRLELEKLVKSEKEQRKNNLVTEAIGSLADHIIGLEKELQGFKIPKEHLPNVMREAIKNKRSFDSMRSSVKDAIANSEIEANQTAQLMRNNLSQLNNVIDEYGHLFNDFAAYVYGDNETTKLMLDARIRDEKDRLEAVKKAEEDRIARKAEQDEKDRLEAEYAEQVERDRQAEVAAEEVAHAEAEEIAESVVEQEKKPRVSTQARMPDVDEKPTLDGCRIVITQEDFKKSPFWPAWQIDLALPLTTMK